MPLLPPSRSAAAVARFVVPTLLEIVRGIPAPLSEVGRRFELLMRTRAQVEGLEHIPRETPFILIFNHYESHRVAAWWGPLLLAGIVPRARAGTPAELGFVVVREWVYQSALGRLLKQPFTRFFFDRMARTYGLITVPPVVGPVGRGEGAAGVRRAIAQSRRPGGIVGLAPEGQTGLGGSLTEPPPGAGIFLELLTHDGRLLLPAGIFERDARLVLRIGRPFKMTPPASRDKTLRDRQAAASAMEGIAAVLPPGLRGAYAGSDRVRQPEGAPIIATEYVP